MELYPCLNEKVQGKWKGNWKGEKIMELSPMFDQEVQETWRRKDNGAIPIFSILKCKENRATSNCS